MSRAPTMPHDLRAERTVLGAIILDRECWAAAGDMLRAEHFYASRHCEIWRALETLARSGGAIDTVAVRGQLELAGALARAGGDEYLLALTDTIPVAEHVEHHARRIHDLSVARDAIRTCLEVAAKGQAGIEDLGAYLDEVESTLPKICAARTGRAKVVPLSQAVHDSFEGLTQRAKSGGLRGHRTGLFKLDRMLGGLCAGDLIVVAARPGMGKSSLAQTFAQASATTRVGSLVFSLEMPADQLADRMLAGDSGVPLHSIRAARISREQWTELTSAAERLHGLAIDIVDEPALSVLELRRETRRAKRLRPWLGLVVVDYLQLLRSGQRHDSREQEVAEISRQLKLLAKQERVAVVALSQLNRGPEGRNDKRPMLGDLRESGAIEQDADVVIGIFRDDVYDPETVRRGIAELIVLKQRNGPVGTVKVRWSAELTRFENLAEEDGAR